MDAAHAAAELNEALSGLETALLTPLVSGELEGWTRAAQEATERLSQRLPSFLRQVLHPQYADIARNDPELLPRVQQLIDEDQSLVLEHAAFRTQRSEFAKRASQIKKDEVQ